MTMIKGAKTPTEQVREALRKCAEMAKERDCWSEYYGFEHAASNITEEGAADLRRLLK